MSAKGAMFIDKVSILASQGQPTQSMRRDGIESETEDVRILESWVSSRQRPWCPVIEGQQIQNGDTYYDEPTTMLVVKKAAS